MKSSRLCGTLVLFLLVVSCDFPFLERRKHDAGQSPARESDAEVVNQRDAASDSAAPAADAKAPEPKLDAGAISFDASSPNGLGPADAFVSEGSPLDCRVDASTLLPPAKNYCSECARFDGNLCCVAGGACCASEYSERAWLTFTKCEDGAQTCELAGAGFGPGPVDFLEHAFVPAVSKTDRSGFVLKGAIAPEERIHLAATVMIADHTDCADCADFVGIGLATDAKMGTAVPDVSITVSSVLGQLIVASGARSIWSTTISSGTHEIELYREPTGEARLRIDGIEGASLRLALPVGALWPLVFGRTDERLPVETRARVRSVLVQTAHCESTSAWGAHEGLWPASPDLGDRRAPSVAVVGTDRWVAYESAGVTHATRMTNTAAPQEQAMFELRPSDAAFDISALGDPEWVLERGGWSIYYTAVDREGLRSLGRISLGSGVTFTPGERVQLIAPAQLEARELFAPSATRDPSGSLLILCTVNPRPGASVRVEPNAIRQRA